jgi:TRAP-type C4-dicarboxylate transport system permease small subunit
MQNEKKQQTFVQSYQKFAEKLYSFIQFLAEVIFVVMVIAVSTAVIGRYVFHAAPSWTEEVGCLCLIYLGFLTSALGIKDGRHIRMNLINYIFPEKFCKVMHFCSYLILLMLSIYLVVLGWSSIELSWMAKLPATHMRMSFKYGIVFVCSIFNIFMAISRLLGGNW